MHLTQGHTADERCRHKLNPGDLTVESHHWPSCYEKPTLDPIPESFVIVSDGFGAGGNPAADGWGLGKEAQTDRGQGLMGEEEGSLAGAWVQVPYGGFLAWSSESLAGFITFYLRLRDIGVFVVKWLKGPRG